MNNKYLSKSKELNNENLCPISRKRPINKVSSKIPRSKKLRKSECTTSFSSPILSELKEMGVSILPEEDGSSLEINVTAASVPVVSSTSSKCCSVAGKKTIFAKNSKELSLATKPGSFDVNPNNSPLTAEQNKDKDTTPTVADDLLSISCESKSLDKKEIDFNSNNCTQYCKSRKGNNVGTKKHQLQQWTIHKNISQVYNNVQKGSLLAMMLMTTANNASCKAVRIYEAKVSRSPLATIACNSFTTNSTTLQSGPLHINQNIGEQQYSHTPFILIKSNEHNTLHHQHSYKQITLVNDRPSSSVQIPSNTTLSLQKKQTVEEKQTLLPPPPPPPPLLYTQRIRPISPMKNDPEFFLYRQNRIKTPRENKNYFNLLSDEILLQIFKWLPKKSLLRCGYVCRRFNRCASDESLWSRLDLGCRTLKSGSMENILKRGVVILRLAQSEICGDIFETKVNPSTSSSLLSCNLNNESFVCKLQYLDLSMCGISKLSLRTLLSCCRHLKKLSLEHLALNDEICAEVAKNGHLGTLNLTMCSGLEAWSIRKMMESLNELTSLNISWTNLSIDAITSLVSHVTPNLLRLNIAGCRKTMFDSHLQKLVKRCPSLLELDVSDCTGLSGQAINIICQFSMLEYLSMSRCYLIPATAYIELKNMPSLMYLDIFGMLTEAALNMLEQTFHKISINKFLHSSVARPTVGTRRTSIWGLRTRD